MNGVVFQTSTMITAASAVSGEAVQAIGWSMKPKLCRMTLMIPNTSLNIHDHICAETTVGIAQGIRTAARSRPRPWKCAFSASAMPRPRMVSIVTEQTVKTIVLRTATHQSGSVSRYSKLAKPMNWATERSARLASVKANQIVRSSGQPATAASTSSIGATNSQAARVRCRVRRELRPTGPVAVIVATAAGPRPLRATSARRATAGPASSPARRGWPAPPPSCSAPRGPR